MYIRVAGLRSPELFYYVEMKWFPLDDSPSPCPLRYGRLHSTFRFYEL